MRILFLDDDAERHKRLSRDAIGHDVTHVWSVFGARKALEAGPRFDIAFLDHDLGGRQLVAPGEDTGYAVAQTIAAMLEDRRPREVILHSFNPVGTVAMERILRDAGVLVRRAPFGAESWNKTVRESLR